MRMPWYMYSDKQCKVLNRIANSVSYALGVSNVSKVMDHYTMLLWSKVDRFYLTH